MKTKSFLLAAFVMLILAGCGRLEKREQQSADAVTAEQLSDVPEHDLYSDSKTQLIKTARYRFQVKEVKASTEAIEAAVRKYPAYISGSSLTLENPILENKMTIRVQSDYFQAILKDIDSQSLFVNFRNISTEDVSEQFVDLESRISTKRLVEQRYKEILQKKAGTITELLDAERQIGAIHEEIEAAIGRINFLRDKVNYSVIELELYQTISEDIASSPHGNPMNRLGTAGRAGWDLLVTIAVGVVYLWPLLLLASLSYFAVRFVKRRRLPARLPQ